MDIFWCDICFGSSVCPSLRSRLPFKKKTSLQGNKTRSRDSGRAAAVPPSRPPCARARPRPPQACISGCDTKAAANGRVEEAMDPSPALNQPPLACFSVGRGEPLRRHPQPRRPPPWARTDCHVRSRHAPPHYAQPPSHRSSSRAPS